MMKKNITVILGCLIIFSVALNIFLFSRLSAAKSQVAVISDQVVETDSQMNDLYQQLADFEGLQEKVANLEQELLDRAKQADTLATSLSEKETQIENLKDTIAENEAVIASLERQQDTVVEKPVVTPAPEVQTPAPPQPSTGNGNISVNTMPGGANFGSIPVDNSGTGEGAIGSFGTYE